MAQHSSSFFRYLFSIEKIWRDVGIGPQQRKYRAVYAREPSPLEQRLSLPGGNVCLRDITTTRSSISASTSFSSVSELSNLTCRSPLQRRNPVIPDTIKLPPGVLVQLTSSGSRRASCPHGRHAFHYLVRRREQQGRRKDGTQSLYIDGPECDLLTHFSSCPPSTSSSSLSISTAEPNPPRQCNEFPACEDHRHFSDPDIPYMDSDV
ncbi:uncharacterized protein LOC133503524 [Syngnathoides biaculeatus]|uniref:uncharacterized protein LOC133503524 n=1 Tax=Syngnathoides biaculeatus TaxID=300417 RepID=UPI002ADD5D3D|nr:uncharacterized protein LOC133503524 [Syngnathoides biaculeatus]